MTAPTGLYADLLPPVPPSINDLLMMRSRQAGGLQSAATVALAALESGLTDFAIKHLRAALERADAEERPSL